jgi:5-formyltetrahydrofolate cyclo-ligase
MRWLKQQVRQRLLAQRCQLSVEEQSNVAELIAEQLFQTNHYQQSHHIALYFAFAGEVSTLPILKRALHDHKSCYVPCLAEPGLTFSMLNLNTAFVKNRFGILEPQDTVGSSKITIAPEALDLVLVPLVAFDANGSRLGMGKGYYDVTFAFLKNRLSSRSKPKLVGLAYEFQKVLRVPHNELDIKLDEVITERYRYQP